MDVVTYALLNKKIKGLTSGVKSASVRGHSIIFELNDGSTQTMTFDQPADGISITDVDINADKHLICTMSDGTSIDAGEILTTKGDKGFSPTITENPDNTNEIYKLDVTNEGGTFTTPNLKGTGGNITVDDVLSDTSENPVQNKIVKAELDKKADKSKIPTELPANGGNSATVNGHTVNADVPENAKFTDTVQDLSPYAKTTDVPAIKVNNAVNADTVDGISIAVTNDANANNYLAAFVSETVIHSIKPANVVVGNATNAANAEQVTSLRHETSYSDIFSTTLTSSHGCWNKWCYVVGSSSNTSATDYIANAPETSAALWYEILTGGRTNRAFQIAIGCFRTQRNMFIRYMHDGTWSGWNKISPAETTALQEYGVTPTLANGTATAVAVSFNPQVVLLMNNGHVITGGYAIAMGAKKFTVTPSSVSTMGTVAPNYIAFG